MENDIKLMLNKIPSLPEIADAFDMSPSEVKAIANRL